MLRKIILLLILLSPTICQAAGPYYVDVVNGNDQDIAVVGDGAYTHTTKTIVKTNAFANAAVGYLIDITGGTNITPGLYQIATNADAHTITLLTAPGTGDQTDITIDDNDGLSEAQAFASLCKVADMINDGEICYVQNTGEYNTQDGANDCVWYIDDGGTSTSWIVWIGYESTITDGGIVKIDADDNTLASAVKTPGSGIVIHNVFKNFQFTGGSGSSFDTGWDDYFNFFDCVFDNSDAYGLEGDANVRCYRCMFDTNTSGGGFFGPTSWVIACIFRNNPGIGIITKGHVINCLLYNNGGAGGGRNISLNSTLLIVTGNTIDGMDKAKGSGVGIFQDQAAAYSCYYANNIIVRLNIGMQSDGDVGAASTYFNNVFYDNVDDVGVNFPNYDDTTEPGVQIGSFVASSNPFSSGYVLAANAPNVGAKAAGLNAGSVLTFWDNYNLGAGDTTPEAGTDYLDAGAIQREESGGGGRSASANLGGVLQE